MAVDIKVVNIIHDLKETGRHEAAIMFSFLDA